MTPKYLIATATIAAALAFAAPAAATPTGRIVEPGQPKIPADQQIAKARRPAARRLG